MGGGHVSRPDFGMPQPDPNHPLTEFYLALQHALDKEGSFALPALYAGFQAPARRVYADEAAEYLTLSSTAGEGMTRLLAPGHLQLLYSSLHVMPDGAPVALLLTEECTRTVFAVQLLPPFVWEDPLPPLPDTPAALTLTLTMQDVEAIDTDPAAYRRRPGDPAVLIASSKRAMEVLGWQPKYTNVEDIIATAWKWHSTHPDGYGD